MPAPNRIEERQSVPLKIVGGVNYGRYPKVSLENTFNFIVSDGFLVPYAGYKAQAVITPTQPGRGLYTSLTSNFMYAVIGNGFYQIDAITASNPPGQLTSILKGVLYTSTNDVYMAENNNGEICFTDGVFVYVYNYISDIFSSSNPVASSTFMFPGTNPTYIAFQNGRLIITDNSTQNWYLSDFNNAKVWNNDEYSVGAIQTKPCLIQAAVPVPGGGNNLLVFGTNVTELWQDIGSAIFPYSRASTFNIDYGCLNPASIAALENFVVWLSYNESSGPTVSFTTGGAIEHISTDGIDFKFSTLTNPTSCTGFLFRQDGHLLYQFTFPDDNLSYAYDFNTKLFFTVTDENLNFHPARQVVFYNNTYYFVSISIGNVYEFGTNFTTADYGDGHIHSIPRIRICPPLRLPDERYYINNSLAFTVENGQLNTPTTQTNAASGESHTVWSEVIDLSISRDGGQSFGSAIRKPMNPTGHYKSRLIFQRLGIANDSMYKLEFSGYGRFVATDGIVDIYR